jgi:hypothetical protein
MVERHWRSLAGWAALLAAALTLIAVQLRSPRQAGPDEHASDGATMLVSVPLSEWSALELLQQGQRVRFERDAEGRWFRHAPVAGEAADHAHHADAAESERIGRVLATLSRARIERTWPADLAHAGKYGLVNPALIVLVQARDGHALLTMEFGDVASDGLSRYVHVPQTRQLHTVPNYHATGLLSLLGPARVQTDVGTTALPPPGASAPSR